MSQFLRSTHFSFIHAIKLMLIHFPFAPAQWHIRIFLCSHHTHTHHYLTLQIALESKEEPRSKSYDIYLGHREERGGDGESWTNGIKRKLVESFEAGPKKLDSKKAKTGWKNHRQTRRKVDKSKFNSFCHIKGCIICFIVSDIYVMWYISSIT